jgi:hypothetical protein
MAGDHPSDQFEYLFDPIAGDTTTTEDSVAFPEAVEPTPRRRRRPLLILAAATVAGAVLGLTVVQLWPKRVEAGTTPDPPATRPAAPPVTTSESVELTTAEPAPASEPEPEPEPELGVTVESSPPAPPPSSVAPSEPAPRPAPSPTLRTPISVSPEPRPAFPNQPGGNGKPPEGGLLPGLGLPGPL